MRKFIARLLLTSYFYNNRMKCVEKEKERRTVLKEKKLSFFSALKILFKANRVEIPQIDVSVGTICTLKCKKCNQYNPYLRDKRYFNADEIIREIQIISEKVDFIYELSIIGGEAFGHRELHKIINSCTKNQKIGFVVVVTNGTLKPYDKLIRSLNNSKIKVSISNYDLTDESNRDSLIKVCEKNEIKYTNNNPNQTWYDFGPLERHHYGRGGRIDAFKNCWCKDCVPLINGFLYRCDKIYILNDQGIVYKENSDGIIKISEIHDKNEFKKKLKYFYSLNNLEACDWCNYGEARVAIKSGEQLEH